MTYKLLLFAFLFIASIAVVNSQLVGISVIPSLDQSSINVNVTNNSKYNNGSGILIIYSNTTTINVLPICQQNISMSPILMATLVNNCSFNLITLSNGDLQYIGIILVYLTYSNRFELAYQTNITITRYMSSTSNLSIYMNNIPMSQTQITSSISSSLRPCYNMTALFLNTTVNSVECFNQTLSTIPYGVTLNSTILSVWQNSTYMLEYLTPFNVVSNLTGSSTIIFWANMGTQNCTPNCFIQSTLIFNPIISVLGRRLLSTTDSTDNSISSVAKLGINIYNPNALSLDTSTSYLSRSAIIAIATCVSIFITMCVVGIFYFIRYGNNRKHLKTYPSRLS